MMEMLTVTEMDMRSCKGGVAEELWLWSMKEGKLPTHLFMNVLLIPFLLDTPLEG